MKRFFRAVCLSLLLGNAGTGLAQELAIEPFLQSAAIDGPTGLLTIPTAQVINHKNYILAVHKYLFKASFGFSPRLELGVTADSEKFRSTIEENQKYFFHGKYRFLADPDYPVAASLGFLDRDIYLSFDKYFINFYNIYASAGLRLRDNGRWRLQCGLAKIINTSEFIFDKEGGTYNFGYRLLLSHKIKLDLGLINLQGYRDFGFDNLVFGINFSEPLW